MILKLILKDNTELTLADASYMTQFIFMCENQEAFNDVWSSLTEENLSSVTITADGEIVHRMGNLVLDGAQAVINPQGTITGHFYFHGATTITDSADSEYVEAAKILLGEGD